MTTWPDDAARSPAVTVCPTCRRIVYRADGHRCDLLRDYEKAADVSARLRGA